MQTLLKVYGHLYPCDQELEEELSLALEGAIANELSKDLPLLERDKDLIRLSFEGLYFPEEEVLEVIKKHLNPKQHGKIDFLLLDEWRLRRYFLEQGQISSRETSLNNVLDYSGF